jgi:NADPH:quinone reductase-like Zn-dependent oxidoreductase
MTRYGGPEVLAVLDRPVPPVTPGRVRINVRAAGINFADLVARVGVYLDAPRPPCVLGFEVAGEIEAIGAGVTRFREGDKVVAVTRFGGQSELVSVPEGDVFPLPSRLSFEQGAAIAVNYGTAYAALVLMAGLRSGERVLVQNAAGGVGLATVQIARVLGAQILGTASAAKHGVLQEQGVAEPIDYRRQDLEAQVMRLTQGQGVDVVIDGLGPASYRKGYRLLRCGGRLVMLGMAEAQTRRRADPLALLKGVLQMPFATFPWWKSIQILKENKGVFGLNLLAWWDREGSLARVTSPLLELFEAAQLEPVVAESFAFERADDAHRFIMERRNVGKVVLTP